MERCDLHVHSIAAPTCKPLALTRALVRSERKRGRTIATPRKTELSRRSSLRRALGAQFPGPGVIKLPPGTRRLSAGLLHVPEARPSAYSCHSHFRKGKLSRLPTRSPDKPDTGQSAALPRATMWADATRDRPETQELSSALLPAPPSRPSRRVSSQVMRHPDWPRRRRDRLRPVARLEGTGGRVCVMHAIRGEIALESPA